MDNKFNDLSFKIESLQIKIEKLGIERDTLKTKISEFKFNENKIKILIGDAKEDKKKIEAIKNVTNNDAQLLTSYEYSSLKRSFNAKIKDIDSLKKRSFIPGGIDPIIKKFKNIDKEITRLGNNLKELEEQNIKYLKNQQESNISKKNDDIIQSLGKSPTNNVGTIINNGYHRKIEISWENISFLDGYILIRDRNKIFEKYKVNNSRKSINSIKNIYFYKNVPRLKLEVFNDRIIKIENENILFDLLEFMSFKNSFQANKYISNFTGKLRSAHFSRDNYRTLFRDVFQDKSLEWLSKQTINELPIIPLTEVVINGQRQRIHHESFLFPIKKSNLYQIWVWESLYNFKATYIFKIKIETASITLQNLYDYFVGLTINKREMIINNLNLAIRLELHKRVPHANFEQWKSRLLEYKN